MLEQKYYQWEQSIHYRQSNLLRVAKLYFEHRHCYLTLKELRTRLYPSYGFDTAKYCLIQLHGFKFEVDPETPEAHRLVDIQKDSKC
ncbi:hypothetical protein ACPV5U_28985 [Vibrio mediterranei]